MTITRDNYESFFLDYLEGNLDESVIDQFLDFLEQHPDLKEELQLFENIELPKEKEVFTDKETLYKTAAPEYDSFELKAIAYMEGDLKDKEHLAFTAILDRNPQLRKDYALLQKTRLVADTQIIYPAKEKLYKNPGKMLWLNWTTRAAAVMILLLGIYTLFQRGEDLKVNKTSREIASVKEPVRSLPQPAEAQQTIVSKGEDIKSTSIPGSNTKPAAAAPTHRASDKAPEIIRDQLAMERIDPLPVQLQEESAELALAVSHPIFSEKINDQRKVMTMDEYLASRAKKATNEGILSAHRLLRVGLNVASELSGDRLGYTVKDGKVASLGFESKLLAFELPLEKK